MQTKSDMVLVNMWPWGGWPWERKRRLERGMVVTFRYVWAVLLLVPFFFPNTIGTSTLVFGLGDLVFGDALMLTIHLPRQFTREP